MNNPFRLLQAAEKLAPKQKALPQRLKPHSNNTLTAALKRCATQKQARDRFFPQAVLAVSLLFTSLGFCQSVQESTNLQDQKFETSLASGAKLRLHLHAGDFRVVGSDAEKISVHVEGKNVERAKHIKIQVKRSKGAVDLKLSHVPKNELQVTIEIPKATNLYARMRGGDLSVEGVAGDKDLELTGGDLTIQVGSAEDYAHVDLSVTFGDVSGTQFGDPKGWIGNSVSKDGNGKYRLHAHVMAGDLVLKSL
ncbi:MAG: hypothetical protein WBQ43_14710 [Terriglobales bacterium]